MAKYNIPRPERSDPSLLSTYRQSLRMTDVQKSAQATTYARDYGFMNLGNFRDPKNGLTLGVMRRFYGDTQHYSTSSARVANAQIAKVACWLPFPWQKMTSDNNVDQMLLAVHPGWPDPFRVVSMLRNGNDKAAYCFFAYNPNVDLKREVFDLLARGARNGVATDQNIIQNIMWSTSLTEELLLHMVENGATDLANAPCVTGELLEKVVNDAIRVGKHTDWENGRYSVGSALVENPHLSEEQLQTLFRHDVFRNRELAEIRALRNPNTPTETLMAVARRDRSDATRIALAGHPNTPTPLVRQIAKSTLLNIARTAERELERRKNLPEYNEKLIKKEKARTSRRQMF